MAEKLYQGALRASLAGGNSCLPAWASLPQRPRAREEMELWAAAAVSPASA